MTETNHRMDDFELARTLLRSGDLLGALRLFEQLFETARQRLDWSTYLAVLPQLLRAYAERLDFERLHSLIEAFDSDRINFGLAETPEILNGLGICHAYAGRVPAALEQFQKCVGLARSLEDRLWMTHGHNGAAMCYTHLGQYEKALLELSQVDELLVNAPHVSHLEKTKWVDLKISKELVRAMVHRFRGELELALASLEKVQESLVRDPSWYGQINLFYNLGVLYLKMQDRDQAMLFLKLADNMLDPNQFKQMKMQIDNRLREADQLKGEEFDLQVLNGPDLHVIERTKGKIEFGKQMVLFDLLNLFLKHPGTVFSKEELVERVWAENYDPKIHDNKLFVTLRRLRRLIEVDDRRPRYILRARGGYYFNDQVRVVSRQESTP